MVPVNSKMTQIFGLEFGNKLDAHPLVLFMRNTRRRYKSSVRHLKRRQRHIMGDKLVHAFADKRKNGFWSKVRQLNRSSLSSVSIVDGVSGSSNIANFMASKLQDLLNTHSAASRDSPYDSLKSSASFSQIKDIAVSEEDVMHVVHELKRKQLNMKLFSGNSSLPFMCTTPPV